MTVKTVQYCGAILSENGLRCMKNFTVAVAVHQMQGLVLAKPVENGLVQDLASLLNPKTYILHWGSMTSEALNQALNIDICMYLTAYSEPSSNDGLDIHVGVSENRGP